MDHSPIQIRHFKLLDQQSFDILLPAQAKTLSVTDLQGRPVLAVAGFFDQPLQWRSFAWYGSGDSIPWEPLVDRVFIGTVVVNGSLRHVFELVGEYN